MIGKVSSGFPSFPGLYGLELYVHLGAMKDSAA